MTCSYNRSMSKIGIIGGSGVLNSELFSLGDEKKEITQYGEVTIYQSGEAIFIQRHGKNTQPHMINHKANIQAMKDLGVKYLIGISSSGSLKEDIKPGDLIFVDDYMQLGIIPTFFEDKMRFTRPEISSMLREKLILAAEKLDVSVHPHGTYIQTHGPRYETKAEVGMFKNYADVVGMTIASEATLANEAQIPYAVICSVDNYAHGLVTDKISWDNIVENQRKNLDKIRKLVHKVIEELK